METASEYTVSFIIPAYNCAESLSAAVESVLVFRTAPFEILICDDGSTDETGEIADEYAARYPFIRAFHTENRGVSAARNLCMEWATGKYLFFCDGDDRIIAEGVETLLKAAEQTNHPFVCGAYETSVSGAAPVRIGQSLSEGIVAREGTKDEVGRFHRLKTENLFGYCFNKLFRRSFLLEHGISFDRRITYMEDAIFILKIIAVAPHFYFLNKPVYTYNAEITSDRGEAENIAEKSTSSLDTYGSYLKGKGVFRENYDLLVPLAMRLFCWTLFKTLQRGGSPQMTVRAFGNNAVFSELLADEEARKALDDISSPAQRAFYRFCFGAMEHGNENLLIGLFSALFPLMKQYINRTVR